MRRPCLAIFQQDFPAGGARVFAPSRQAHGETTLSTAILLWGVLFSSIGLGFFIYGKKRQRFAALLCGVGLMVFPYFVSDTVLLVLIGAVLVAIPLVVGA